MIPVQEILKAHHVTSRPPALVIDETVLKSSNDVGPVCGCDEKYDAIKRYVPFIPGAVNPYKRRVIPECLHVHWKPIRAGELDLVFEKPIAVHVTEIPENFQFPEQPQPTDNMLLKQHKYTDEYVIEKLRQCHRQHIEGCACPK